MFANTTSGAMDGMGLTGDRVKRAPVHCPPGFQHAEIGGIPGCIKNPAPPVGPGTTTGGGTTTTPSGTGTGSGSSGGGATTGGQGGGATTPAAMDAQALLKKYWPALVLLAMYLWAGAD